MKPLRPFFSYYGGKWRAAPRYPAPMHDTIVEPFAGSAGYSLRYPDHKVILIDKDPNIVETWRYLLRVSEAEILSLPDIKPGQTVDDIGVHEDARRLIGWWLNSATTAPRRSLSKWQTESLGGNKAHWGLRMRQRIADQIGSIRHWRVIEGDYTDSPDAFATWFVDPPYQVAGTHYRCGSGDIDFGHLAQWCRSRRGQVVVCENKGAYWLPFVDVGLLHATSSGGAGKRSAEVVWTQGGPMMEGNQLRLL